MAVKKENGRRPSRRAGRKRRDTARLSEMLAPLEEQDEGKARAQNPAGENQNHGGAIIVDSTNVRVPMDLAESEKGGSRILGLEPVVLAILALALAFIVFVAYLISIEPPK